MNKRINTFDTEEQYDNYIWSAAPEFPNVGYVKESDTVHYQKEALNDYTIYGTTTNTADFTLKVGTKTINCAVEPSAEEGVYIFHSNDSMEDIGNDWMNASNSSKNLITIKRWILNTSTISSFASLFSGCSTIKSFDFSSFNTSNVINMSSMFKSCSSLTTLDLSNFDTSNVTNMIYMFESCSSLTTLDLSNFDTSNVTNMSSMFKSCSSLTTLDLSNFDTSNVTNMSYMFMSCSSLTTLDLSNFDTSNVTSMSYMFFGCSALKTIYVKNCDEATQQKILDSAKSANSSFTLSNGVISRR